MALLPRIADVSCSKLLFQPGDRILVKSFHRLDIDQKKKLISSIKKWAGCDVEVLVICTTDFDITIDQPQRIAT
jgi:hypothetical protein